MQNRYRMRAENGQGLGSCLHTDGAYVCTPGRSLWAYSTLCNLSKGLELVYRDDPPECGECRAFAASLGLWPLEPRTQRR